MNDPKQSSAGSGGTHVKVLDWRRVRAGWYVAPLQPGERGGQPHIHIRRANDDKPHWGWDIFFGDNDYELPPRERLVFSGAADLGWAKLQAEHKYGEYRPAPSNSGEGK